MHARIEYQNNEKGGISRNEFPSANTVLKQFSRDRFSTDQSIERLVRWIVFRNGLNFSPSLIDSHTCKHTYFSYSFEQF